MRFFKGSTGFAKPGIPTPHPPDKAPSSQGIEERILVDLFGFCGCGASWEALGYIRDVLAMIGTWGSDDEAPSSIALEDGKAEKRKADILTMFPTEGSALLVLYLLASKDLIDHGVSLSAGCWLSEDGKALLEELNTHFAAP